MKNLRIPIETSARHMHLTKKHLEKLFGKGHELAKLKDLSQKGEFAACEEVEVGGKNKNSVKVRVVGPCREVTQVELSKTDAIHLGLNAPVHLSGDIDHTPGVKLSGPKGELRIRKGVIISKRHLHINPEEAKKLRLKNNDRVKVEIKGIRGVIYENVVVRIKETYKLAMHIDTDEADAAGLDKGIHYGVLVK